MEETKWLAYVACTVRRTLSFSLHEMAKILGREIAEQKLLPVLDMFLKDLDEVKVGVVQHLRELLEVVSPERAGKYMPVILELLKETENWRIRLHVAEFCTVSITSSLFHCLGGLHMVRKMMFQLGWWLLAPLPHPGSSCASDSLFVMAQANRLPREAVRSRCPRGVCDSHLPATA